MHETGSHVLTQLQTIHHLGRGNNRVREGSCESVRKGLNVETLQNNGRVGKHLRRLKAMDPAGFPL